jgi:hypothetical protein
MALTKLAVPVALAISPPAMALQVVLVHQAPQA